MLQWFYGSINPRVTDIFFGLFFPAGFMTFFWDSLFLGTGLILYLTSILIQRYTYRNQLKAKINSIELPKLKVIIMECFFALIIGIWNPAIAFGFTLFYSIKSTAIIRDLWKKIRQEKILLNPLSKFFRFLYYLINIISVFAIVAMVPIGFISKWIGLTILVIIGLIFTTIYLILLRVKKSSILSVTLFKFPHPSKAIKVGFILIPIIFASILITSGFNKYHDPAPNSPTTSDLTKLRIITYNIRYANSYEEDPQDNWNNRKDKLAKYIDSLEPDIFGVQEAYWEQVEFIKANLQSARFEYTGFGRDDGVHGGEHAAIFFKADRFIFLDGDTFWLSDTPLYPSRTWENNHYRICTWARFKDKTTNAQFCVFCTHYDFTDYFHMKASHLIIDELKKYSGGLPTFLMGDFNLVNESKAYNYLITQTKKPLVDSYVSYHNGTAPPDYSISYFKISEVSTLRIDFIFITNHVQVNLCRIPKDSYNNGHTYSDHYPVLLDCEF